MSVQACGPGIHLEPLDLVIAAAGSCKSVLVNHLKFDNRVHYGWVEVLQIAVNESIVASIAQGVHAAAAAAAAAAACRFTQNTTGTESSVLRNYHSMSYLE